MQVLATRPGGRCLCLLDAAEVGRLQPGDGEGAWPDMFLRQMAALPLQESTYNVIARGARAYPNRFVDKNGHEVTLATWERLVLSGPWRAPGGGDVVTSATEQRGFLPFVRRLWST